MCVGLSHSLWGEGSYPPSLGFLLTPKPRGLHFSTDRVMLGSGGHFMSNVGVSFLVTLRSSIGSILL